LIAEAFGRVGYPILPLIESSDPQMTQPKSTYCREEILHIRHHSLYTPRDFDLSPFFQVVKPTIERGFDYKTLKWAVDEDSAVSALIGQQVGSSPTSQMDPFS
jgi:hypothetical protein